MSTSRDARFRPDDELVTALSRWLAGHIRDDELRRRIEEVGTEQLAPGQAEAVGELLAELERAQPAARGHVEMVARETAEALALGE